MKISGNCNHNYTFLISFFVLFVFVPTAQAQQKLYSYSSIGISHIQFQEDIKLQKTITRDTDLASYRGTVLQFQRQSSMQEIGFSIGAIVGMGRAVSGGSGENLSYNSGTNWLMLGVTPKAYYRWTRPISFGLQGLAFYKNISWNDDNGISAESAHNFNFALLGDMTMQLASHIEFVQSVGSMNGDATLWKIGINYLY